MVVVHLLMGRYSIRHTGTMRGGIEGRGRGEGGRGRGGMPCAFLGVLVFVYVRRGVAHFANFVFLYFFC